MKRRTLIKSLAAAPIARSFPGRRAFAKAAGENRLIVVILRGGMDGLAAVPPVGDPAYGRGRDRLAIPKADTLSLDDSFALHPCLANLHGFYKAKEAVILHAIATPYRERSHFDGQDLLENGTASPKGARDGWLARALDRMPGAPFGEGEAAVALARSMPLILRGSRAASSWAPSAIPTPDADFLARVAGLYEADALLAGALMKALVTQEIAGEAMADGGRRRLRPGGGNRRVVREVVRTAGALLSSEAGPRIGVIEVGGWDTHAGQGGAEGRLAKQLSMLDDGLVDLKAALGRVWATTAVAIVTEFGRTAAQNGSGGTDHGTASAAVVVGGAVNGGRVIADWPGLGGPDLYEGRDLRPTLDMRRLFKGLLHDHLKIPERGLETAVFPDSAGEPPLYDLVKV